METSKITKFDPRPIDENIYKKLPDFEPISHPLLRLMIALECGGEHDGGKEIREAMDYYNKNIDKWNSQH